MVKHFLRTEDFHIIHDSESQVGQEVESGCPAGEEGQGYSESGAVNGGLPLRLCTVLLRSMIEAWVPEQGTRARTPGLQKREVSR